MCQERVGANLMFALELITLSFLCTMGEHKVRPYIGFGHWLDFDYYDLPENL